MTLTAGIDIGGAHLKVALIEQQGEAPPRTLEVRQFPCPLWQGFENLDKALSAAAPMTKRASRHAITMTGELSDLFTDRLTGVAALVQRAGQEYGRETRFWMGTKGFGTAAEARAHPADVGSTNFLATAMWTACHHTSALLIDFGSTTADIVPIRDGAPVPRGVSDAERQVSGELVYTGFTRTAVMGVTNRALLRGAWVGLAREYLATMADVRRILGVDLSAVDQHATADGKGKSVEESVVRLARMFGCDSRDAPIEAWRLAAAFIREQQLRSIHDGALQVISAASLDASAPIVVAGIGAGCAGEIGTRLGRTVVPFSTLVGASSACEAWASYCAPAVAVALLSSR